MKLALIARQDKSGLGQGQTLRLARLLNPDKIMLIDSTSFNGAKQFPEWYKDYGSVTINGFPNDLQIRHFISGLDIVLTCETFYNIRFTIIAKDMGVKTVCIANPEFFDWFKPNFTFVPRPDKVIIPSEWMMDRMSEFNATYLPTPIFEDEFKQAREINLKRTGKPRYLFMNGKTAAHDRNGLESVYEALHLSKGDFEIVIKAQGDIKKHPDPRIIYDFSNPDNQEDLYKDYDAMILPRRYAGQALPMTEALQSALPVIMTDIDPNNKVLPKEWLVPATKTGEFMTRTLIDIFSATPLYLAEMLDASEWSEAKKYACHLNKQYDAETLRPKYEELLWSL